MTLHSGQPTANGYRGRLKGAAPRVDDSYIRGGGGVAIDSRRLVQILLGLTMVILAVFAVIFAVVAVNRNARVESLKHHGVPVEATVTSCVGMASGTGITEVGYGCRGSFTVQGRAYNEPIRGTGDLFAKGQKVAAVTLRDNPAVVYTAASAARMTTTWTVWVTPLCLLATLVVAGFLLRRRTRRRT